MSGARIAGIALVGGLVLLLGLRLAWVGRNVEALQPVGGGDPAPDFTLPLLAGGDFHLAPGSATAAGPITLIDFWATWCEPCREELPHVDALHRRYKDRGVRVVAVDAEGSGARPGAERLAKSLGLSLPIALGGDGVAERYKVNNLPQLVLIDRKGRIAEVLLGVQEDEVLSRLVDEALKK